MFVSESKIMETYILIKSMEASLLELEEVYRKRI